MSAGRRKLLGGVAAAAIAPAAIAAPPSSDAEVIRLARAVIDAEGAYRGSFNPPSWTMEEEEAREAERDRLLDVSVEQAEMLATLPAVTLAGVLAKARAALAVAERDAEGNVHVRDYIEGTALTAIEDLVRVLGGSP